MSARIDHESRRLEIAYKAMKLFSQVGYDNVTLIMIASSAGVARTVLYRYFRSKREVLDAAILATTRQIMQECSREIAKRGKAADRLSMVCFHVADVLFDKKEFMSAIGIKSVFVKLVTEGVMKGEFLPEVNPERTAEGLYAILESCVLRIVLGTETSSANVKVRVSDMIRSISA